MGDGAGPATIARGAVDGSIIQLLDAGLGWQQGNPEMTVLPAAMGVVHVVSATILTAGDG